MTQTDWNVVCPVTFRHAGNPGRIASSLQDHPEWQPRINVVMQDLAAPYPDLADKIGTCDYVIALASLSSVSASIDEPVPFVRNNVDLALFTLEYARRVKPSSVIIFSTDEVYGPMVDDEPHAEWSSVLPSNPYAASKAAQEAIAVSYWRTYGVPVTIVNSMNLIGEMQDPVKFLPVLIKGISRGDTVPIYGTPADIGSRYFIHARNVADALIHILDLPPAMFPSSLRPSRYNVVGEVRLSNLELAEMTADIVGRPLRYELIDFHSARPGHDPHYGLDGTHLASAGWKPPMNFAESLASTVRWTLAHPEWM